MLYNSRFDVGPEKWFVELHDTPGEISKEFGEDGEI